MKFSTDDPKLTAYALGEMNEAERAEFERELARSPELRAAVEEIRATAAALQSEFASEGKAAPGMDASEVLARAAAADKVVPFPHRTVAFTAAITALAACVVGLLAWQFWFKDAHPNVKMAALPRQPITVFVTNTAIVSGAPLIIPVLVPSPGPGAVQGTTAPVTSVVPVKIANVPQTNETLALVAQLVADGKQLTESNQLTEAESKLKTALKLDPDNRPAAYYLDRVYAGQFASVSGLGERLSITNAVTFVPQSNRGNTPAQNRPTKNLPTPNSYARQNAAPPGASDALINSGIIGGGSGNRVMSGFSAEQYDRLPPKDPHGGVVYSVNGVGYSYEIAANELAKQHPGFVDLDSLTEQSSDKRFFRVREESELMDKSGLGSVYRKTPINSPVNPGYVPLVENPFRPSRENPLSTFSIDVDTGSYANVRRFLNSNQLPPRDAVRLEELINYFPYHYAPPTGEHPFSVNIESAGCPWNAGHRLLRVALKGKEIAPGKRPPSNFVFLIDVSGSMQPSERLPLIKQGLRQLVKRMTESDRVAIVVYASEAGVKLASTSCANKEKILAAIDALEAGGSTNGEGGIREAYRVASENFIKGGVNRVLLCTDGDFNVGVSDQNQLVEMIQEKAKGGVFLTTLGVGTDNYKDALMQKLADKGNGNYHYLDSLEEAQKVLVEQMNANFVTIAKDVKIQIEFNPSQVGAYRLLGYEKRLLRKQDFNDDTKDAGEIGAGHTVTALYEIIPAGAESQPIVDDLKYQKSFARPANLSTTEGAAGSKEMLTLKLRYKKPDGDKSQLLEIPHSDPGVTYGRASSDFRFAAAVASFGMVLRDSQFRGGASLDAVLELAEAAKGDDENGYRAEFINLVKKAQTLKK